MTRRWSRRSSRWPTPSAGGDRRGGGEPRAAAGSCAGCNASAGRVTTWPGRCRRSTWTGWSTSRIAGWSTSRLRRRSQAPSRHRGACLAAFARHALAVTADEGGAANRHSGEHRNNLTTKAGYSVHSYGAVRLITAGGRLCRSTVRCGQPRLRMSGGPAARRARAVHIPRTGSCLCKGGRQRPSSP